MIRHLAAAAVAGLALPALAATYEVSGTGHGASTSTPMPVGETAVLVHASSTYDRFEMADAENPLSGLKGPCFGAILIESGQPSGNGKCHYTDPKGGVVVMDWVAEAMTTDGRMTGTWSVSGGTGAWAEATGTGTFDAGTGADGAYTNKITGELTVP